MNNSPIFFNLLLISTLGFKIYVEEPEFEPTLGNMNYPVLFEPRKVANLELGSFGKMLFASSKNLM